MVLAHHVTGWSPALCYAEDGAPVRLTAKGKKPGRAVLGELTTILTPETILRWHRELMARKYNGSKEQH